MKFTIDGRSFQALNERCGWLISHYSRQLTVTIVGRMNDADHGSFHLLDEFNRDREISFQVSLSQVYDHGLPSAVFQVEEDRLQPPSAYGYLNREGFDYRLKFDGTVAVHAGGVQVNGRLRDPHSIARSAVVEIDLPLDPSSLEWEDYQFTTLEELSGAPEAAVRHLKLTELREIELPNQIRYYTELRQLLVYGPADRRLPLAKIPRWIGRLRKLSDLQFTNCSLPLLPHELGELSELITFGVSHSSLRAVPVSILRLPRLRYLYLAGNKLRELSDDPQLPTLSVLNVNKNELTHLSEAWAHLPKLRRLDLSGNPWKWLPPDLLDLPELVLDVADKQSLFDYTYPGAGGRGTVVWDDRIYHLDGHPELIHPLERELFEDGLMQYRGALLYLAKLALAYEQTDEEDYADRGNTRFGGMPDLPPSLSYPTFEGAFDDTVRLYHYEFIAQIDCEAVADLQAYLPRRGILYFFLSTIHDVYGSPAKEYPVGKVIYYDGQEELGSGAGFSFGEDDYFEMIDGGYRGYKTVVRAAPMLPSFYAIGQNEYLLEGPAAVLLETDDESVFEKFDYVSETLSGYFPGDHYVNGYGFSQHEFPQVEAANYRRGRPQDWLILLTVTSRGDMQWGDAGDLFFLIHKSDLAKQDFSNIVVTMYSS